MDSTLLSFENGHGVSVPEQTFRLLPDPQLKLGRVTPILFSKPMAIRLDPTVEKFIIANNLSTAIEVFTEVEKGLRKKTVDQQGQMTVEVDEEDPSWTTLVIEFKVRNMPYTDLLSLWEVFSDKFYAPLDRRVKEKVRLVFEPA